MKNYLHIFAYNKATRLTCNYMKYFHCRTDNNIKLSLNTGMYSQCI